ncbi:hypothetical protein LJR289_004609 [Pseudoduganella sp. LjRoot289]|uniref:hypothetical protein n=1 Tax=Pseudoduganella sp. LjRoot289 TaxID=3342314 RepID=UPI003ECCB043
MPKNRAKSQAEPAQARQQFETLLAKLPAARADYAAWEAIAARLRHLAKTKLGPLSEQFCAHTRELILVFEEGHSHPSLNKDERAMIAETICMLADGYLLKHDDSDVAQLYQRHSGRHHAEVRAERHAAMDKMLADAVGGEPHPDLVPETEQVLQKAANAMRAKLVAAIRTLPSEQQPDLLELADVACVNQDVLALMALEIELEHLQQPGAAHLDYEQLQHHIMVLDDYLADLEFDTVGIQFSLIVQLSLPGNGQLTEHIGRQSLHQQQFLMERQMEHIACDVVDLRDIAELKAWLKEKQQYAERQGPVYQ